MKSNLLKSTPKPIRGLIKTSKTGLRELTSTMRSLPDYIIIGAQRCGTTSLFNYLNSHPNNLQAYTKEVHFFTLYYSRGINWYKSQFPLNIHKAYSEHIYGQTLITGEATPYYIFHPHVPNRVANILPKVKMIALLRNPIDRAYSHYHHEVRKGREKLSFHEAIAIETQRIEEEIEKMLKDESYYSFNHHRFSYLARGIYIDQLSSWMELFPSEQILVLKSEQLFNDTQKVLQQVFGFLNLPIIEPKGYKSYNRANNPSMDSNLRKRLDIYFEPHNNKLYEYLGIDFNW